MIIAGTFVRNENVADGCGAAMKGGELLWVGPIQQCPLDRFFEGVYLHVSPALYERIQKAVAKVEKGVPRSPIERAHTWLSAGNFSSRSGWMREALELRGVQKLTELDDAAAHNLMDELEMLP